MIDSARPCLTVPILIPIMKKGIAATIVIHGKGCWRAKNTRQLITMSPQNIFTPITPVSKTEQMRTMARYPGSNLDTFSHSAKGITES